MGKYRIGGHSLLFQFKISGTKKKNRRRSKWDGYGVI